MADVKWIKIVTDIFDDEKILLVESLPEADSLIVVWFKLLCLAGKQNNGGVFMLNDKIAYTEEMLATIFRRPLNTIRLAIQTFTQFGMIEVVDNVITIPNWDKHQNTDSLDKIRAQNRKRVNEYRERQKNTAAQIEADTSRNVTVTLRNGIEEEREEEKIRLDADKRESCAPTLAEVQKYCEERKNNIDAKHFFNYYSVRRWQIHGGSIDWKAAVRSWETNKYAPPKQKNEYACKNTILDRLKESG